MKVYSFPRGGISFDDPAAPSRNASVTAFLPALSVIPLMQHAGDRAYPVVAIGETVREGMLIGRGQGPFSANVHAAVPGRVVKLVSWKTAGGKTNDALVIRMEGAFERLGKREEFYPWEGLSPHDLQRVLVEYGVVEMEGEGRPISDILSSLRQVSEPITLVVRCVFDDPWLAADYVLCRERLRAVAEGGNIMGRASRAGRILYAVSRGEADLGEALLEAAGNFSVPASMVLVGSRYPQRNGRELELVLRNYAKREGIDLGVLLMLGPATLAAAHDAIKLRKPILDRYIAVGGGAVKVPQVMKVRIGTRIGEVFAECGGFVDKPRLVAMGSPLLGRTITDLDEPVTKTSFAVFALPDSYRKGAGAGCISCGECRTVCPVGLDPEELFKQARMAKPAPERPRVHTMAAECHGCGCCEVVCPSRLPLSSAIADFGLRGAGQSGLLTDAHSGPQVNLARSCSARMWLVSLCALMAVIQSSLSDSFSSLIIALGSIAAAVLVESLVRCGRGDRLDFKDGGVVTSALVLALLLPNRIHPLYACIGSAFAVLVIKNCFGGLGSNWLNPAAGGWLFLRLSWPGAFREALAGSPLSLLSESLGRGVSNPQGSPLGLLKIDGAGGQTLISAFDTAARSFLNNTVFSLSGAELPGGYMDLLSSSSPGIIADRGLLALLLGTIIITAAQVNRSWIPALFLGVYGLMVRIFGALPYGGETGGGDLLFGLFSGGVIAGAFILAADPATGAK
ncbi:MAG: RnfABCDGE type electron transport complex subunit D, partial [Treponema sp.]|nr:RnfABCDGE type electron transport complex subunit D [Treponema sp.]